MYQVKSAGSQKRKAKQTSEALVQAGFQKVRAMTDAFPTEGLDEQFRESLRIAEELRGKCHIEN